MQELEEQLSREKDQRQHEVSSLQDAQAHKMAQMRKKHKEEVAELRAKIQEMDWGSEGWETQVLHMGRIFLCAVFFICKTYKHFLPYS